MHVEQRRGTIVESRHHVHVAVVDGEGLLVAQAGDPDLVTFWRSAAKPFQALPLVTDGVAERFGLTREMLAIACASHSSEPSQVQLVRDFLAKIGCSERDLLCGPHPPLSDRVAKDYEARGVRLTAVYSNCSGKHAAMLGLARYHDWPTEFYARLEHPVQQRCLAEVSRWSDVPVERVGVAVDGCGVACFAIPLRHMALAYARLGSGESAVVAAGANRITEAMLRHPELVAGEGRPCTDMMRAHPGRVITKVGADGVYSALLTQERLGVALKGEDGHGASAALAMAAGVGDLGRRPPPEARVAPPGANRRGEPGG